MLPQSSIRSSSESVPAIQSVPLVRSLIHTQPLTRRSRRAEGSAPVSGFGLVGHAVAHAGERGRRGGDVEDAAVVHDRRERVGGSDLVERRERRAGRGIDAAEHLTAGRDRDERRVLWGGLGEDGR